MRIGILSDTHGNLYYAQLAIKEMEPIDMLLHAGDLMRDVESLELPDGVKVEAVIGNCDFTEGPKEKLLELEGKKIFLTHGHDYNVKRSYQNITYRAKELGADVVVFGHTHFPEITEVDFITLFNPGSISKPRINRAPTYGVIEIKNDQVFPYIFELKRI